MSEDEKTQLTIEIQEELRRQLLKAEILKDLRPVTWKDAWARFAQHPAFLTFMSFILSGFIGGSLAVYYQAREWNRQQQQLVKYHRVEERYKIMDELIKAVAAHHAVILEVTSKLEYNPHMEKKDRIKLEDELTQGRKEWHVAVSTLQAKMTLYFNSDKIMTDFISFSQKQDVTTYPEILTSIQFGSQEPASQRKWDENVLKLISNDSQILEKLITTMKEDTEELYRTETL